MTFSSFRFLHFSTIYKQFFLARNKRMDMRTWDITGLDQNAWQCPRSFDDRM